MKLFLYRVIFLTERNLGFVSGPYFLVVKFSKGFAGAQCNNCRAEMTLHWLHLFQNAGAVF